VSVGLAWLRRPHGAGGDDLTDARAGKQTLSTHEVEVHREPGKLGAGRRAKPNAQAALLIRLVERFPDTVERLAVV
jgi:putative transcriptional regulator